ncbi:MAG: deoxyguanosinetriphosphate triphosphohydrolase family protein [bacterium]
MKEKRFSKVGMFEGHPKWEKAISRAISLSQKPYDLRTVFERDYTRILHGSAYRRLKHKTQVFYATKNDHICTRIEHVNHVASVSHIVANHLGLNTDLTKAIATGHDLGHAPFGHIGEKILSKITEKEIGFSFWHEKNSLKLVDKIETLENSHGKHTNLFLTYATRDGIVSHCGEVDENGLKPRKEAIELSQIKKANEYAPFTWEGCIVKIADKISYLGRDIEDALRLGLLTYEQLTELKEILSINLSEINNTNLVYKFTADLCKNSSPERGICFSEEGFELINQIKEFNYKNIYFHGRLLNFNKYAELIINSLYSTLDRLYDSTITIEKLQFSLHHYPKLIQNFIAWLIKYSNIELEQKKNERYENKTIYDITQKKDYKTAIIDFIAGMSDQFVIELYEELIRF